MIDREDFISYITVKKGLADSSIDQCTKKLTIINRYFGERELSKDTIESFFYSLKEKGYKNNTLNTYLFAFQHIKDYFVDRGKEADFMHGFKSFPKVKTHITILTPDEITKIINTLLNYGHFRKNTGEEVGKILNFRMTTAVMFLAYTGCRFEEIQNLQVKDLDLSLGKAIFLETKNKDNRFAFLPPPLIKNLSILVKNKQPVSLVFTSLTGNKIHATDFINDIKMRAKKAGITKRVHPHLFRHSFATQLLMSGVDVTMVASLLGHKDIQTTFSSYVHLADETLRKATYRHPLIRKSIDPTEILKNIRDVLAGFRLDEDFRFAYTIEEGTGSLSFKLLVK